MTSFYIVTYTFYSDTPKLVCNNRHNRQAAGQLRSWCYGIMKQKKCAFETMQKLVVPMKSQGSSGETEHTSTLAEPYISFFNLNRCTLTMKPLLFSHSPTEAQNAHSLQVGDNMRTKKKEKNES
jgi:hypothetical protein